MGIKQIEAWRCSDGTVFENKLLAETHEKTLNVQKHLGAWVEARFDGMFSPAEQETIADVLQAYREEAVQILSGVDKAAMPDSFYQILERLAAGKPAFGDTP